MHSDRDLNNYPCSGPFYPVQELQHRIPYMYRKIMLVIASACISCLQPYLRTVRDAESSTLNFRVEDVGCFGFVVRDNSRMGLIDRACKCGQGAETSLLRPDPFSQFNVKELELGYVPSRLSYWQASQPKLFLGCIHVAA